MSFVSILGSDEFITVVTDGRAMGNGKVIDENVKKFEQFGNKFFAYAGSWHISSFFVDQIRKNKMFETLPLSTCADIIREMVETMHSRDKSSFSLSFGGEDENGQICLYYISTTDCKLNYFEPLEGKINKVFLCNTQHESVETKFVELMHTYGTASPEATRKIQEELNDYVSTIDSTVNKTKFFMQIVKKKDSV